MVPCRGTAQARTKRKQQNSLQAQADDRKFAALLRKKANVDALACLPTSAGCAIRYEAGREQNEGAWRAQTAGYSTRVFLPFPRTIGNRQAHQTAAALQPDKLFRGACSARRAQKLHHRSTVRGARGGRWSQARPEKLLAPHQKSPRTPEQLP